MIYFDNAATSFPKPRQVIDEVVASLTSYGGNPGRSAHRLSLSAGEKIYSAREAVSELLNIDSPEAVVFTQNATHALNIAIKGIINKRCHVIISDMEHNSVIRPLIKQLRLYGGEYSVFDSFLDPLKSIPPLIRPDTAAIIASLRSNVTGHDISLRSLSRLASEHKLELILDASQLLGHKKTDLSDITYSALCSAGHKGLYGIQGSGILVLGGSTAFDTLIEGGSGIDSFSQYMPSIIPERFEAGTASTPAIASLLAGIGYLNAVGIDEIEERLSELTRKLHERLINIKGMTLYGINNGIAAFNLGGLPSSEVARGLDIADIAVRAGFHCAPLIHKRLGTEDVGAVRVSLSHQNCENELDKLYYELKKQAGA